MYKMKAICNEHQGLISFIDECGCECGSVHYDIFKRVLKVDLSFESSFVHEGQKLTKQLIEKLVNFKGVPQELDLPSAPKQFIRYMEEDNRPQVTLDVNYENGMGVSVGRLREDTVYDYKFVGLSHNTVRGAAGGAVLCAETLKPL